MDTPFLQPVFHIGLGVGILIAAQQFLSSTGAAISAIIVGASQRT